MAILLEYSLRILFSFFAIYSFLNPQIFSFPSIIAQPKNQELTINSDFQISSSIFVHIETKNFPFDSKHNYNFISKFNILNFESNSLENVSNLQDSNKLEFDEEEFRIQLLPERLSIGEKFLWGSSGLFRKIGITSELSIEQREKEIRWRRRMLNLHQIGGLLSWSLMLGTVVTGQLWLDGKLESPIWHKRFLYSTIPVYFFTGLLAILCPPPLERRNELSSTTLHKYFAWIHFLGMVATPIIGKMINSSSDYYKTTRIHQKIGYITFSTYSLAMLGIILLNK